MLRYFLLANLFLLGSSFRILALFPHPSLSHVNVFLPLVRELSKKGHEVTLLSHYGIPEEIPSLRQLVIDPSKADLRASVDLSMLKGWRFEKYINGPVLAYLGATNCHRALASPAAQDLLHSDETFDLVLMEFFNTDCFAPFAHKFKAPLVGMSSCTIMPWSSDRFGIPTNPSYVPSTNMDFSDRMGLLERMENTLMMVFQEIVLKHIIRANDDRIIGTYFKDVPPIRDIIYNSSLFLVNSHFSLNLAKPAGPAVVEIGGIHLGKVKKLPQELEKWINESTDGVIYFSLGSMVKGNSFPLELRGEFLKAFGRLPQRVLWKYENETMPGKPDNVRVQNWLPQLDVLCHPNVKAFISHGGLLGTIEAVNCGVPIIVMPLYGDQHTNAKAIEANKGGVILKFHQATEEKVYQALKTVLEPSFRDGARALSERFRDRPLPPLETAIYWVEYVARHRGAHHMRTAAVDMPFYQYFLLDVFLILILASVISWKVLLLTYRFVRGRKSATQKQKKT